MRVLVTGGAGFVGAFTALDLVEHGHEVVAFDRRAEQNDVLAEAGDRVTLLEGDIRDRDRLAAVVREHGIEGIIHTAAVIGQGLGAESPDWMFTINVVGTLNVLEVARAAGGRVVYVSTATLYGQHPDLHPLTEEHLPDPVGMYDTTKLMAETLVHSYHKIYGLDTVAVRPGYVYGLWDALIRSPEARPWGSVGRAYEPQDDSEVVYADQIREFILEPARVAMVQGEARGGKGSR